MAEQTTEQTVNHLLRRSDGHKNTNNRIARTNNKSFFEETKAVNQRKKLQ
jgi:hypothetical protein